MTGDQQPLDPPKKLSERLDIDFALEAAGLGIWEIDPATNQVNWDQRCRALVGLDQDDPMPFQEAIQYIHPDDLTRVLDAMQWAMKPESGGGFDQTYRTLGADGGKLRWVRFRGRAYFQENGHISRFAGIAQELTQQVEVQQQEAAALQQSEARFRTLIEEAPVATCLFVGQDMRIEVANQAMIKVWGKGMGVIGLPVAEALPELKEQPFLTTLEELFVTGNSYQSRGGRADLVVEGQLQTFYFDYDLKPLRNPAGEVYAILETAIDVTSQVLARQKVEQSEAALQSLVDLAELGSYRIEVDTNTITKSPRVAQWYGLPEVTTVEASVGAVADGDRLRVSQVLADALEPGSDGSYKVEYAVINQQTGHTYIVRTIGHVRKDPAGQPLLVEGMVFDITAQRELQLALEQQIRQRTQELATANQELAVTNEVLAATNEELASSNEEYAAINRELAETNSLLNRSNDNLEKFAYVASHDLQEPLRKIRQFGDLLKTQQADLSGESIVYLERMQSAASRMSTLIKDLLDYSRIAPQRDASDLVSLQRVVGYVMSTLELRVEELGAQIRVGTLPTVLGDEMQLNQLFQNLISNALKFHQSDQPPRIDVMARLVAADQLPPGIKPGRFSLAYHHIEVIDNGIGFNEKYVDRIFQVFQRLHGKSAYAGTGIGLAICERVVFNHGGAITASSQPGQGATFSVYLPV